MYRTVIWKTPSRKYLSWTGSFRPAFMVREMPCQCSEGWTAGVPATLPCSKMGEKSQIYAVCKFLCLSVCVWRSVCGPRIDRRNTEQCCWGMMLPSYSNFVIVHFPKHSLPFLPPNVADLKATQKKSAWQQLNFLYHNKSVPLGEKKGARVLELSTW